VTFSATISAAVSAVASLRLVTSVAVTRREPTTLRLVWALAAAVIALEVPYPLVHGDARDTMTVVTVVVFGAASLAHAQATSGTAYAAALAIVAGGVGFVAELIGVHTGVPFGHYRYTGGLGPGFGGVPVIVAVAWLMMAHPSLVVASRLTHRTAAGVAVAAWALASWDVFLDPQMVSAGHWRWTDPSPALPGVTGVPIGNYAGWIVVALLVMAALVTIRRAQPGRTGPTHDDGPAVALWGWTWLSSSLANLAFFDRPAVAAWGFAAMGAVGVPLLVRSRRAAR
jgi:uncharacterized membrane protein